LRKWLPYCFGQADTYINIPETLKRERNTYVLATGNEEIKEAYLYWSPGGKDIIWQARYWVPVKAELKNGQCVAEVPPQYANLPLCVFMDAYNSKGQKASTVPSFEAGTASDAAAAPFWDDGQLWDCKNGLGAWRPEVSSIPTVPRKADIHRAPPYGLEVGPFAGEPSKKFIINTSSIGLVAGAAATHAGLSFTIDGHGAPGSLKLALFRNFHSAFKEEKFAYTLQYDGALRHYSIAWKDFTNAKRPGANLFPFDNLQIEGVREDGSPITIQSIAFQDP